MPCSQLYSTSPEHDTPGYETHVHVVPLWVLAAVFVTLLAMTYITVAATWFNLGNWNLYIALGIATFKAALVLLYFMHLRYDNPFNAIVLITALLFVVLFLSLTLLDTFQYQGDIQSWEETRGSIQAK
ncbi:MAG TPA: cytochrome C oxidase subunit IV family protein [Thermoguttaceae bacterium]